MLETNIKLKNKSNKAFTMQYTQKMKEILWKEIDNYITQIRKDGFDKKTLNYGINKKLDDLKEIVLKYLKENFFLSQELISTGPIKRHIKDSIAIIYLLKSTNPKTRKLYTPNTIKIVFGTSNVPRIVKPIQRCLGIYKETKTEKIWMETNKYTIELREKGFDKKNKYLNKSEKFDELVKEVKEYLIKKRLIERNMVESRRIALEKQIKTIYLLGSETLPTQDDISAKFKISRSTIKNIEGHLGISRNVENDPIAQERVCIKCGEKLNYEKFKKREDGKTKSTCKNCYKVEDSIRRFQNKLAAVIFVLLKEHALNLKETPISAKEFIKRVKAGETFDIDIKCPECGVDLHFLPTFQFHHPNHKIKTITWHKMKSWELKKIIIYLDNEECIMRCANCHQYKKATFILDHLPEIQNPNTIDWSRYRTGKKRDMAKNNFKRNVNKRKIMDDLYNSRCAFCKKSIYDEDGRLTRFLAAVDFHHLFEKIKKYVLKKDIIELTPTELKIYNLLKGNKKHTWGQHLWYKDLYVIKYILLYEKQIATCKNCHWMETTQNYEGNEYEIFSKYLKEDVLRRLGFFIDN